MTKIEKIYLKHSNKSESVVFEMLKPFHKSLIYDAMKEYAEFYAKKCLEITAQSASANFECVGAVLGAENVNPYVEVESILKIKLPPHD